MRIYTHATGFFDWIDVADDVEVTKSDIDSGKVKPAADWTKKNPKWQVLKEFTYPSGKGIHENLIIERDLVNRCIGEYTRNGKQRRIITRHQAVEEHIRWHALLQAQQLAEKHMLDVEIYDEGPNAELFDDVMKSHLAADHGRVDGKNVDAEDVDAIRKAYLTPGPSTEDHGTKATGPAVYPDHHPTLAGQPHDGPKHAAGVRTHLLRSFRMGKKG